MTVPSGLTPRPGPCQSASCSSSSNSAREYWRGQTSDRDRASMKLARLRPAISAAFPCETRPTSYHLTAAATRISSTNSSGVLRRAEKTASGNSRQKVCTPSPSKRRNEIVHPGRQTSRIFRMLVARTTSRRAETRFTVTNTLSPGESRTSWSAGTNVHSKQSQNWTRHPAR